MPECELIKLGFTKGETVEVIVSTYNGRGEPNAAPMGVTLEEGRLVIRPYLTSHTYLNLVVKGCGVVNLTSDPELFYRTAVKGRSEMEAVPCEWFIAAESVDAPRLKGAEAYLEFQVVGQSKISVERAQFICVASRLEVKKVYPKPYSRATFALIESIIYATKVREYLSSGRVKEVEPLLLLINHYKDLIGRVAPASRYALLMADLVSKVESWRAELCESTSRPPQGST
ncbi:MAG: DUF447 family protein [Candidatus Bathyarchaeia archaeon]